MAESVTIDSVKAGDPLPPLSVDVNPTLVILGALATRDWRPMHHDRDFAIDRNGVRDIFMNTPNQAAWFERYITDWSGPKGRLGRMKFRMRDSVFPGDTMVFNGTVEAIDTDEAGCSWASVAVSLTVDDQSMTTCAVRIALPAGPDDNPWKRTGDRWNP